jgi:hypothetical protein
VSPHGASAELWLSRDACCEQGAVQGCRATAQGPKIQLRFQVPDVEQTSRSRWSPRSRSRSRSFLPDGLGRSAKWALLGACLKPPRDSGPHLGTACGSRKLLSISLRSKKFPPHLESRQRLRLQSRLFNNSLLETSHVVAGQHGDKTTAKNLLRAR